MHVSSCGYPLGSYIVPEAKIEQLNPLEPQAHVCMGATHSAHSGKQTKAGRRGAQRLPARPQEVHGNYLLGLKREDIQARTVKGILSWPGQRYQAGTETLSIVRKKNTKSHLANSSPIPSSLATRRRRRNLFRPYRRGDSVREIFVGFLVQTGEGVEILVIDRIRCRSDRSTVEMPFPHGIGRSQAPRRHQVEKTAQIKNRDGVSEGQFSQILLEEMDAIRKIWCASERCLLKRRGRSLVVSQGADVNTGQLFCSARSLPPSTSARLPRARQTSHRYHTINCLISLISIQLDQISRSGFLLSELVFFSFSWFVLNQLGSIVLVKSHCVTCLFSCSIRTPHPNHQQAHLSFTG
ncbi:hypothetical protein F511_33214 [Dorcoceras hygrometricum]|uniref:Uncharacterized protein n=1 Tax=Dorcoceras hygrometricum TaxID=472368 RepID=A0A2Z7C7A0_9LAMI|nr:hypothetical protein F511_33214 [Dorcoceras hygrometricum]